MMYFRVGKLSRQNLSMIFEVPICKPKQFALTPKELVCLYPNIWAD